jgi:glutamate-5-semialdehyde dehydrogenase
VIIAKTQRPSVCNAAEKLLVHQRIAAKYVPQIVKELLECGVEVRGDDETRRLAVGVPSARRKRRIGLKSICASALRFGWWRASKMHSPYQPVFYEKLRSQCDPRRSHARLFLRPVYSAVVYWNASSRFSDGGEVGFGAKMASARKNCTTADRSRWRN